MYELAVKTDQPTASYRQLSHKQTDSTAERNLCCFQRELSSRCGKAWDSTPGAITTRVWYWGHYAPHPLFDPLVRDHRHTCLRDTMDTYSMPMHMHKAALKNTVECVYVHAVEYICIIGCPYVLKIGCVYAHTIRRVYIHSLECIFKYSRMRIHLYARLQ